MLLGRLTVSIMAARGLLSGQGSIQQAAKAPQCSCRPAACRPVPFVSCRQAALRSRRQAFATQAAAAAERHGAPQQGCQQKQRQESPELPNQVGGELQPDHAKLHAHSEHPQILNTWACKT